MFFSRERERKTRKKRNGKRKFEELVWEARKWEVVLLGDVRGGEQTIGIGIIDDVWNEVVMEALGRRRSFRNLGN